MMKVSVSFIAAAFLGLAITGASFAEDVKEKAGNVVSQAAHTAKSEGQKGRDLAGKVHEAIDARKEAKGAEKAAQSKPEDKGKEVKEKGAKQKQGKMSKQNFGNSNFKGKGNK